MNTSCVELAVQSPIISPVRKDRLVASAADWPGNFAAKEGRQFRIGPPSHRLENLLLLALWLVSWATVGACLLGAW